MVRLVDITPACAAMLLICGCSKDETAPVDLGYAYFPTDTGRWIEYQVDSAWYIEPFGQYGSVSYRLRETILEDFTDPEGRPAQRIRRAVWDDSLGIWRNRDIWWQVKDSHHAEKTEENLRRLKLAFPVRTGTYWNANVYNTLEDMEVTYEEIGVPWSANGLTYDSTVTVEGTYFNNPIDTIMFEERYAKHVGMVSKHWIRSNTQSLGTTGWRLDMTAVAFGQ